LPEPNNCCADHCQERHQVEQVVASLFSLRLSRPHRSTDRQKGRRDSNADGSRVGSVTPPAQRKLKGQARAADQQGGEDEVTCSPKLLQKIGKAC
jgi:hypothetical protein